MMGQIAEIYREHPLLWAVIIGMVGLAMGSFLQLAAQRTPAGMSVVMPPSRCDKCGREIRMVDLIPVINYFILGGRCRHCKAPLSAMHPAMEGFVGLVYFLLAWKIGFTVELAAALLLFSLLFVITWTDITHRLIPDRVIVTGLILIVPIRLITHPEPLWSYAPAFFLGSGVLYVIDLFSRAVYGKAGVGGGDIKLFAWLGLVLGWKLTAATLFLSCILGLIGTTLMHLFQKSSPRLRGAYIPFGPYMAAAAMTSYLWGDTLIRLYFDGINALVDSFIG